MDRLTQLRKHLKGLKTRLSVLDQMERLALDRIRDAQGVVDYVRKIRPQVVEWQKNSKERADLLGTEDRIKRIERILELRRQIRELGGQVAESPLEKQLEHTLGHVEQAPSLEAAAVPDQLSVPGKSA